MGELWSQGIQGQAGILKRSQKQSHLLVALWLRFAA